MSTAATPKPTLTTIQIKSYKTLPDNWRKVASESPLTATAVRSIAAAFAILVDGEGASLLSPDGKERAVTVADEKYSVGYHSRVRAEYLINNSPSLVRDAFSGADPRRLRTIHDELKAKKKFGKHEEPLEVDRIKGTATVFELKYELYELLSNDDLDKVLKYALARLHPDNKETGDEVKYKRIGELWSKIRTIEGV